LSLQQFIYNKKTIAVKKKRKKKKEKIYIYNLFNICAILTLL